MMRKLFMVCLAVMCWYAEANEVGQEYRVSTLTAQEKATTTVTFNVWLKLKNEKELDQLLANIYSPESPQYQKFLTWKQFYQRFTLSSKEKDKVKTYLVQHGFTLLPSKENFYIRAQGTALNIERAFKTPIKKTIWLGRNYYSNAKKAVINSDLNDVVSDVSFGASPGFHSKCIPGTEPGGSTFNQKYGVNATLTAELVDDKGKVISPSMTFRGFTPNGTHNSGYTPQQIQHAYGVDKLISKNIDGRGQTVVIIDTCLSATLQKDLDAFTTNNQLPPLVQNSNFFIVPYKGNPLPCPYGATEVPAREETLDIEGFHTMAPKAKIILAVSTNESVDDILTDAIEDSKRGYLISSSHSEPESTVPSIESSLKGAACTGITVNISSGDCGDNRVFSTANYQKSVNYPSSSPWVTAVGGTALFLDKSGNYWFETGWGTARNISYKCKSGGPVCTSYTEHYENLGGNAQGFVEGATGGISQLYPAQPWQQNTIGDLHAGGYAGIVNDYVFSRKPFTTYRAVPDVSMFADGSYPGFEIYFTPSPNDPEPSRTMVGGTSLACPLFTGILALLSQERQHPIGLASRFLYDLPPGAMHIISNPHGFSNPLAGLPNPNAFQLFHIDPVSGDLQGIVYNFDSSLTLGPIWSDVVGVGSPYAPSFVNALIDR